MSVGADPGHEARSISRVSPRRQHDRRSRGPLERTKPRESSACASPSRGSPSADTVRARVPFGLPADRRTRTWPSPTSRSVCAHRWGRLADPLHPSRPTPRRRSGRSADRTNPSRSRPLRIRCHRGGTGSPVAGPLRSRLRECPLQVSPLGSTRPGLPGQGQPRPSGETPPEHRRTPPARSCDRPKLSRAFTVTETNVEGTHGSPQLVLVVRFRASSKPFATLCTPSNHTRVVSVGATTYTPWHGGRHRQNRHR